MIATADITMDVPFSSFPGISREFCIAYGSGVVLTVNGLEHRCLPGQVFTFRGDDVVFCTLIDGPCKALNLMVKDNACLTPVKHMSVFKGGASRDGDGKAREHRTSTALVAICGPAVADCQGSHIALNVLDALLDGSCTTVTSGWYAVIE